MDAPPSHFNVSSQQGSNGNVQQQFVATTVAPSSLPQYQTTSMPLDTNGVSIPVIEPINGDVSQQLLQAQAQAQLQQQMAIQFNPNNDYYYNPQTGQTYSIPRVAPQQQNQVQQAQAQAPGQGPALMFMQPQRVVYHTNQQPVTMQMQPQLQQNQLIQQQSVNQAQIPHQQQSVASQTVPHPERAVSQMQSFPQQASYQSVASTSSQNPQQNTQSDLSEPSRKKARHASEQKNHRVLKVDRDDTIPNHDTNSSSSSSNISANFQRSVDPNDPLAVPDSTDSQRDYVRPSASLNDSNSETTIPDFHQHPFQHLQSHSQFTEGAGRSGYVSGSGSIGSIGSITAIPRFEYEDPQTFAPPNSEELIKNTGQMLMVGIGYGDDEETQIEQLKQLITKYGVGNIILSSRHMKDSPSTRDLILELQRCAKDAGHELPLNIAIDQENGMLNNLYDDEYLTQFPGSMAMVATQSQDMARQVAKGTGLELKALGINWTLGPVVDVLSNSTNKLLGVRTMGDDPKEVTQYSLAYLEGYQEANIATCGKHFPGYGNANVDETLGLPIVYDTIEQLETASLIPYRQIIKKDIDAIMVGSCALPKITRSVMHACLSEKVVTGMLRGDMGFNGVIVSECLEMKTLYEDVGVRQGTVLAALAGCDVIIVCSSYRLQLEALSGILGAVRDGIISPEAVKQSSDRIIAMKRKHLSWDEALNPPSLNYLKNLHKVNQKLANDAYERSLTILRDHGHYIPLNNTIEPDADILLLTPLVVGTIPRKQHGGDVPSQHRSLLAGEDVFHDFGKYLARYHTGKITHTSYTDKGMSALHETLLERAKSVIVVTTDAGRNTYQVQFSKTVGIICTQQRKPMVAIAASSPYDLALDRGVGTYICLYEFTPESLETAAKVLFGKLQAKGIFPGSGLYQSGGLTGAGPLQSHVNPKRRWLVERFSGDPSDFRRLKILWENCFPDRLGVFEGDYLRLLKMSQQSSSTPVFEHVDGFGIENQTHFIVRNSSTQQLYGFCATWVHEELDLDLGSDSTTTDSSTITTGNGGKLVGCILMLFVDPFRRSRSIGQSLHERAMKYLITERKVSSVRLGARVPSYFEGIPLSLRLTGSNTTGGKKGQGNEFRPSSATSKSSISTPLGTPLPTPTVSTASPVVSDHNGSFSGPAAPGIPTGGYNPIDLVEWFRHVGWHIPRAAGSSARDTVHTLEIDGLKTWNPHSTDLRRLTKAGITLRLAGKDDREKVLNVVKRAMQDGDEISHTKRAKMAGLWKLYKEVMEKGEANVILAVSQERVKGPVTEKKKEGTTKIKVEESDEVDNEELIEHIQGTAIIFSRSSPVAYSMPWLLEFDSARVGGMCGIISEPSSELMERIAGITTSSHEHINDHSAGDETHSSKSHKPESSVSSQAGPSSSTSQKEAAASIRRIRNSIVWGVVGCGLQAFKDSKWQTFRGREFDRCCIDGVDGQYVETLRRMGFRELKRFLEVCEYGTMGGTLSEYNGTKESLEVGSENNTGSVNENKNAKTDSTKEKPLVEIQASCGLNAESSDLKKGATALA